MCGISGIINKKNQPVDPLAIKKINDLIYHRGPDEDGFYFGKNFAFGHRRLSIIDLTVHGRQPMSYLDRYWMTYNGEVFNYLEIRAELIDHGYSFVSESDSEVILAAYDQWGSDCLTRFNGMWSFVIFDNQKNTLFFARDRFGIKPMYYSENDEIFSFGSEIKQLLNQNGPNYVNQDVLLESLLTHIDNHTENTYFKGVFCFPSSHYMVYNLDDHSRSLHRYYELKVDHSYKTWSEKELNEKFTDLFHDSVKLRLRSDVQVGTCLSGGLDSSAISTIASEQFRKESGKKFVAVNAKSMDASNDESHFARIVADEASLDLNTVMPDYEDFLKTIDDVVHTQEEPFGSPSLFMSWHVFKKARELNCIVMLNGQGGDEVLLGYERYFASTISLKNPFHFIIQTFNQSRHSRISWMHIIEYYFYFNFANLRIGRLKKKSFVKNCFKREQYFKYVRLSANAFEAPEMLQIYEITIQQLPHLLRYEDRNSMRHSIETRLPFLDYRLVEFAVSLPLQSKIHNGWTKFILRKSCENMLSDTIVWRKNKFGFEAPEKIWLTKYSDQMLAEITGSKLLQHFCDLETLKKNFSGVSLRDKWIYFNIARWEKIYNIEIDPSER